MTRAKSVDELATRTLPHNLEAEKVLLGSLLVTPALLDRVVQIIRPKDFFRRGHQAIFTAMVKLGINGKSEADLTTLNAELERTGELDEVGGPAYISALTDGVPRSTNAPYYAAIVKEKALLRQLIYVGNDILVDAYDAEQPVETIISKADKAIVDLQKGVTSDRLLDVRETSAALYAALEHHVAHKGELAGVETGFASINELTDGWTSGDMIVLAARPSIGKTAFVLNTAVAGARAGKHVAIFSLEMRRRQLEYRLLAQLSGVEVTRIRKGYLGDTDLERVGAAMSDLNTLPLWIDDRGSQTVWDIRAACRRLRAEVGLDLVVIDYIQLMAGDGERRETNRQQELATISRRLKILADEISAPLIVLSQLSRAAESRQNKRPQLSDLRDTGALEQDADLVCFLHRNSHKESGTTNFILEKQRNGPTGTVNITFDKEKQQFVDGGEDLEQPPATEAPPPPEGQERTSRRRKAR